MAGSGVLRINEEEFGKDHWSLLAYIETRCVDHKGEIDRERMRCNPITHPHMLGFRQSVSKLEWKDEYGSRLKDRKLSTHDDWDCLDDLDAAGLVEIQSLATCLVKITEKGNQIASEIRMHKTKGGNLPGT
jgi:hypothetical protein